MNRVKEMFYPSHVSFFVAIGPSRRQADNTRQLNAVDVRINLLIFKNNLSARNYFRMEQVDFIKKVMFI
jgi:hypothetical protein